jgi:hypothetical protein
MVVVLQEVVRKELEAVVAAPAGPFCFKGNQYH